MAKKGITTKTLEKRENIGKVSKNLRRVSNSTCFTVTPGTLTATREDISQTTKLNQAGLSHCLPEPPSHEPRAQSEARPSSPL